MDKIIKEFIIKFIYTSIVLLFVLGWITLPIILIHEAHPIYGIFTFSFFTTLFIFVNECDIYL